MKLRFLSFILVFLVVANILSFLVLAQCTECAGKIKIWYKTPGGSVGLHKECGGTCNIFCTKACRSDGSVYNAKAYQFEKESVVCSETGWGCGPCSTPTTLPQNCPHSCKTPFNCVQGGGSCLTGTYNCAGSTCCCEPGDTTTTLPQAICETPTSSNTCRTFSACTNNYGGCLPGVYDDCGSGYCCCLPAGATTTPTTPPTTSPPLPHCSGSGKACRAFSTCVSSHGGCKEGSYSNCNINQCCCLPAAATTTTTTTTVQGQTTTTTVQGQTTTTVGNPTCSSPNTCRAYNTCQGSYGGCEAGSFSNCNMATQCCCRPASATTTIQQTTTTRRTTTTTVPVCGNGIPQTGEQCDDGNSNNNDGCKNNCRWNVCGDGVRYNGVEACDDGNRANCDGCRGDCSRRDKVCGDGITECGEVCDDGNTDNCRPYPGCNSRCTARVYCGNNVKECSEGCDGSDWHCPCVHDCNSNCGCDRKDLSGCHYFDNYDGTGELIFKAPETPPFDGNCWTDDPDPTRSAVILACADGAASCRETYTCDTTYCGDGTCDSDESREICAADCKS